MDDFLHRFCHRNKAQVARNCDIVIVSTISVIVTIISLSY